MVWYVAIVAVLNLGLGYALAVYLGAGRARQVSTVLEATEIAPPADLTVVRNIEVTNPENIDGAAPRATVESPTPTADEQEPDENVDPVTGLTTRARIEERLADLTLSHADLQPMTVALVEVDQSAPGAEGVDDRLLRGVAETVRELLRDVHSAGRYAEQQFLLLLPHDDLRHATERAEQVRQRIAATQYVADGQQIQATVTCALAQVAADHTATSLLEFLEETLDEAKRYGGNRTFMHDGTAPTPVVPPELNIAPQTCAI